MRMGQLCPDHTYQSDATIARFWKVTGPSYALLKLIDHLPKEVPPLLLHLLRFKAPRAQQKLAPLQVVIRAVLDM